MLFMVVRNSFKLHSFCMILPKFALYTESLQERYKSTRTKIKLSCRVVLCVCFLVFEKRHLSDIILKSRK